MLTLQVQDGILLLLALVPKNGVCVQANKKSMETVNKTFHQRSYRLSLHVPYMASDNKFGGYNKNNDEKSYLDSTHSGDANNGSTYNIPSTDVRVQTYDNVNIVRQPCNRGTKGSLPKTKGEWVSNIHVLREEHQDGLGNSGI